MIHDFLFVRLFRLKKEKKLEVEHYVWFCIVLFRVSYFTLFSYIELSRVTPKKKGKKKINCPSHVEERTRAFSSRKKKVKMDELGRTKKEGPKILCLL